MATLVCLGLGYCARHYVSEFGQRFDRIVGTTRSAQRAAALAQERLGGRPTDMLVFDGTTPSRELAAAIARAEALLISAAPAEDRDPVLAALEEPDVGPQLAALFPTLRSPRDRVKALAFAVELLPAESRPMSFGEQTLHAMASDA